MTVVQLRKVAKDLALRGYSKMTKTELMGAVETVLTELHIDALVENDARKALGRASECHAKSAAARVASRINNYMRFNGSDKLTPAQWRRARKAMRKAGVTIGQLNLTFP